MTIAHKAAPPTAPTTQPGHGSRCLAREHFMRFVDHRFSPDQLRSTAATMVDRTEITTSCLGTPLSVPCANQMVRWPADVWLAGSLHLICHAAGMQFLGSQPGAFQVAGTAAMTVAASRFPPISPVAAGHTAEQTQAAHDLSTSRRSSPSLHSAFIMAIPPLPRGRKMWDADRHDNRQRRCRSGADLQAARKSCDIACFPSRRKGLA
jgi:hypothetical protein